MTTTATNTEEKELPSGWKWVKLGDVATLENGDRGNNYPSRSSFVDSGVPFINAGHLENGSVNLKEMNYITQERFDLLSSGKIQEHDFLFCLRGSLGKYASVGDLSKGGIASSLTIIRCHKQILHDFMKGYLDSRICKEMIASSMNGAAQPNLAAASLRQFRIPLPPLEEQKRIAGILQEQMAAVEEAKKAAQQRLEAVKALPAAYLREVFPSSEDELPDGWKWVKLGDVCEKVGSGSTPRGGQSVYKASGTPFIRSQNVLMNNFTSEGLAHIPEATHAAMSNTTVKPEDVLLNITGASIGRVCVVPRDICPANVNQHVSIIRTTKLLSATYLSYFISSDDFQRYIMTNQAGGTRQALTKSQIEQFTVPLPPVLEQSRIASELDDKIAGVKLAEASIEQELDTIEAMPAALLRKAFSGNL